MRIRTYNGYQYHDYSPLGERTFDYLRAWHELAYPAYEALEDEVRKLAEVTCVVAQDQQQGKNLDVTWSSDEVNQAFETMADEQPTALAKAARVVFFIGHWFARPILKPYFEPCGPGQWELIEPEEPLFSMVGRLYSDGGSWKFSNYADQVLRERLGLPPRSTFSQRNSAYFQVHEGMLRLCLEYKNRAEGEGWTWNEVGLATPDNLAKIRKLIDKWQDEGKCGSNPEYTIATFHTLQIIVKKLKKYHNKFEKAWLDNDKFMAVI